MIRSQRKVLRDISWTVRKNENWFVMGNNGSGKTTLLEIILGYLWPQEGEVRVLGEKFGRTYLPDLRKKIGYVAPWVFKRMGEDVPVNEVVASGFDAAVGFVSGKIFVKLQKQINRQLDFFECRSLAKTPFGRLSSGQQLRVVMARALVHQPKLLVLDEPFSLFDIGARMHSYALLQNLSKEPKPPSIILVTHHLEDVTSIFTHGLFLKEGKIVVQGLKQSVLVPASLSKTFSAAIKQIPIK